MFRFAERTLERGVGWSVQDHCSIQLLHERLEHTFRDSLTCLGQDPRANLGKREPALKMAAYVHERVERDQDGRCECAQGILKQGEWLTLMVVSRNGEGAKLRAVQ
jgi:hypothetical protein